MLMLQRAEVSCAARRHLFISEGQETRDFFTAERRKLISDKHASCLPCAKYKSTFSSPLLSMLVSYVTFSFTQPAATVMVFSSNSLPLSPHFLADPKQVQKKKTGLSKKVATETGNRGSTAFAARLIEDRKHVYLPHISARCPGGIAENSQVLCCWKLQSISCIGMLGVICTKNKADSWTQPSRQDSKMLLNFCPKPRYLDCCSYNLPDT